MDSQEILQALKELRDKIHRFEIINSELENNLAALNRARARQPRAVGDFDSYNKDLYILDRIGKAPEKPKGIVKLAIPVYRSKMKAYEKEYAEYKARYNSCERDYYNEYAQKRHELEIEEKKAIENGIHQAEKNFEETKLRFSSAEKELHEDNILNEKYKRLDIVDQLIGYFEDERVDSIPNALNLYYEDEHRKTLERLAKEQLKLTQEAKEYARQAAESAEEAASCAESARSRAEEAYSRAEEAYSRAEEAYDQAQSAYWTASNNTQ